MPDSHLLEDVLPLSVGDLVIETCEDGVSILDSRDLNSGKKNANDAAYNLARSLLAAKANIEAGASFTGDVTAAIAEADALLSSIGFDGTGKYLGPGKQNQELREAALAISGYLDDYNNNLALGSYPGYFPL